MWRGLHRCAHPLAASIAYAVSLSRPLNAHSEEASDRTTTKSAWKLHPRGGAVVGNPWEQAPTSASKLLDVFSLNAPLVSAPSELLQRLSSGCEDARVITQEELEMVLRLKDEGSESWDLVKDAGSIKVYRYRNRGLFQGCFFCKMVAQLPETPKEITTHCAMNMSERKKWDKQVVDSNSFVGPAGNEVMHFSYRASPFSDRDFVVFNVTAFNEDGNAMLIYQRYAKDSLFPLSSRAVRGRIYITLSEIKSEEGGGSSFTTISVVDPAIPVLPRWFTNFFIPGELKQWATNLKKHCELVSASGDLKPSQCICAQAFFEAGAGTDH